MALFFYFLGEKSPARMIKVPAVAGSRLLFWTLRSQLFWKSAWILPLSAGKSEKWVGVFTVSPENSSRKTIFCTFCSEKGSQCCPGFGEPGYPLPPCLHLPFSSLFLSDHQCHWKICINFTSSRQEKNWNCWSPLVTDARDFYWTKKSIMRIRVYVAYKRLEILFLS